MLALIPLVLSLVPEVAKLLVGDKAGTVAAQVADVVRTVTGTDDPATAAAALAEPGKLADLRIRLAEVAAQREATARQAEIETFRLVVSDAGNARDLGSKSTLIARAQVTFASVIIGVVAVITLVPLFTYRTVTIDPFLATVFGTVIGFFFGNSTASNAANADRAGLARQASAAAQPAAIATTAGVTVNANAPSPPGTTADDLMRTWPQGAVR